MLLDSMLTKRKKQATALTTDTTEGTTVRARAFVIGVIFVVLICLLVGYSELVVSRWGSSDQGSAILLGATHMPPGAFGGLIALLVLSGLVHKISPRLGLNRAEILMIYFMMVCAALLSSFGLMAQLLPNLVAINYFADAGNNWQGTFYAHLPSWLVPWDPSGPTGQQVSKAYYEGLRTGDHIPWAAWVVPLAAWGLLAILLFFLMACVTTLFRRQWMDNERLSFPLVQLPVELVGGGRTTLLSNKLLWLGFLVPALIHGMNGLHNVAPSLPVLQLTYPLNDYMTMKPWSDVCFTPVVIVLSMVGFSYLLPLDVSFSFWFFLLLFRFQDVVGSVLGFVPQNAALYPARYHIGYQSAGAFVAVAASMVWLARPHFRLVLRRVFGQEESKVDGDEYMSYRVAFWGMLISFMLIVAWCALAGMTPWVAAVMMFGFVFIIVLVLTRCVSEVGLLMLQPIFRPMDLWAIAAPRAALGVQNLSVLSLLNGAFFRDPRTLMPAFMDSMRGAGVVGARRRSYAIGIGLAVLVAIVAASVIHLSITYRIGGLSLNDWFLRDNPTLYFGEAASIINEHKGVDPMAGLWFSVGMIGTLALYVMRSRFWWWPFHPLGYAMGAAWPSVIYWNAFLTGWACKALILRYGGPKIYGTMRPFFLGLIFGEFASAVAWSGISAVFGIAAPMVPIT